MLEASYRLEADPLDGVDSQSRDACEAHGHEELRRELIRAVRRVCPRSLAEDAEDLVQESFIRLLRAGKLGSQNALSASYLKKVAYSAVVDEIRRRRRQPAAVPASDQIDINATPDESKATPPDASLGHAMEACLQRLPVDRRRAVTLHLLGHSGPEIAQLLECNVKRAENLTLRGLAQLREHLHGMGVSP